VPLLSRVNYLWRLAATGLAFVVMGVGGIVLALGIVPLATLATRDRRIRARRAQRIIRDSFRLYLLMLRGLGVIRLEVVGAENLATCQGHLIVANHPTLLDVVLIMALVPNAQCVVKHQLWRNPFLGPIVRTAGYIRNDGNAETFIGACRGALAAGGNLIIFPEGTRSVPGQRLRFQRGFAHIATLTGANLQLIAITCRPITLVKGQPWYIIPDHPPTFRVEIDQRLEMTPFLAAGARALGVRKLVSHLESYYGGKLKHG
jgi:1-acyl-sn-glycerol-3-phosphate acyltransferase